MNASKKISTLFTRHVEALWYVVTVILPVIVKTGRRPVIFSRFSGMGDIICTIPAAHELMKRHPGATFIYNCAVGSTDVPRLGGVANQVTSLKDAGPIGHWYGFLLEGFYHFAHGDDTPGKVAEEPMVKEFCRQFGLSLTEEHPRLAAGRTAQEKVRCLIKGKNLDPDALVLIHTGPSWTVKEWPQEHWVQLIARLQEAGWRNIAQMGGSYQQFNNVAAKAAQESLPGVVSLINAFSVEECFAVIAGAKLFIGIDSGLLHIAAAARTPSVGIFGSTSPQFLYGERFQHDFVVTGVACAGCFHRQPRIHWFDNCPHEIACMKTIAVDTVLQKCRQKLEASRTTSSPT